MAEVETITVQTTISMGHRLPSYNGICSSPHGHNVRIEVEVRTRFGHFLDFKAVQETLKKVTDPMDHAMVLHWADPLLMILKDMKFRTYQTNEEPTTEALARHIRDRMVMEYDVISVTVHETDKYSATWRVEA